MRNWLPLGRGSWLDGSEVDGERVLGSKLGLVFGICRWRYGFIVLGVGLTS